MKERPARATGKLTTNVRESEDTDNLTHKGMFHDWLDERLLNQRLAPHSVAATLKNTSTLSNYELYQTIMKLRGDVTALIARIDTNSAKQMAMNEEMVTMEMDFQEEINALQLRVDMQAHALEYLHSHLYMLKTVSLQVMSIPKLVGRKPV